MEIEEHFFESLVQDIRRAYIDLEHQLIWSFLYSSKKTLHPNQQLLFMGLNPGGGPGHTYVEHPSFENGNSYLVDDWGAGPGASPLQKQIQRFFGELSAQSGTSLTLEEIMNRTLAANLVPFRSQNWDALPHQAESLDFSKKMWTKILTRYRIPVIVTMSWIPFDTVSQIYRANGYKLVEERAELVGWGKVKYEIRRWELGRHRSILVRIPHLSRFKIFGREKSQPAVDQIVSEIVEYIDFTKI